MPTTGFMERRLRNVTISMNYEILETELQAKKGSKVRLLTEQ